MRNQENFSSGGEIFDPKCPESSYFVGNIEDQNLPAKLGKNRRFDVIVSFVTFCWLTDPLRAVVLCCNELLKPNGIFLAGGIQLLTDAEEAKNTDGTTLTTTTTMSAEEEQKWLFALAKYWQEEQSAGQVRIELVVDASTGAYVYWLMQRKAHDHDHTPARTSSTSPTQAVTTTDAKRKLLSLSPALEYGQIDTESSKVCYKVNETLLRPYLPACDGASQLPSTRVRRKGVEGKISDSVKREKLLSEFAETVEENQFRTALTQMVEELERGRRQKKA
ncbi:unnamed protein product [Amoebophrya sp. A120]|nr:unnamed protein product [Amoebophrya sp. A120]|eukprot:GSA120T00020833001.1